MSGSVTQKYDCLDGTLLCPTTFESKLKSIESKLKPIESKLKSIESKLKSIEIN